MRCALPLFVSFIVFSCTPPSRDEGQPAEADSTSTGPEEGAGGSQGESSAPLGSEENLGLELIGDGSNQCDGCPLLGDRNEWGEVLVFSDDFVKSDLDRSIWKQEVGMIRNEEEQCYLDRDENILIVDGELVLRAIAESVDDPLCTREWEEGAGEVAARYSSASVTTKDVAPFKYGRIEARLRVPDAQGVWPAFWLRSQEAVYGGWPKSGEIDVMEFVSQQPNTLYGTVHFDFLGHATDEGEILLDEPVFNDYHVVSINWTPEVIEWRLDGELYHSFNTNQDIQGRRPFDESFYLILNVAVGGHWPESPLSADYPAQMNVDWVRVWQVPAN